MNVIHHFVGSAMKAPKKEAIRTLQGSLTYKQLIDQVNEKAHALKLTGIKSGDRLLVLIPLSIELYVTILACIQIGAVVVLIDHLFPRKNISYAFNTAKCRYAITSKWLYRLRYIVFPAAIAQETIHITGNSQRDSLICEKSLSDSALITFTSGSTGNPKAADRTHGFLDIQLRTIIEEFGLDKKDIHLSSFPVVSLCSLAVGATAVIPSKRNPTKTRSLIEDVSFISASPYYMSVFTEKMHLPYLNNLVLGGATIFPLMVKKYQERYKDVRMKLVYGGTEVEPIATCSAVDYLQCYTTDEKGVFVGRPYEKIDIRIMDLDSEGEILPGGEIGEILVKGEHVLDKYLGDDKSIYKNKILIDNERWHRTGDAGYMKQGGLYFYGRCKYLWKEDGQWLSPLTLEKYVQDYAPDVTCTWMQEKGTKYCFYEGSKQSAKMVIEDFPYHVDDLVRLKSLPLDKRHHSRINYAKLFKLIH